MVRGSWFQMFIFFSFLHLHVWRFSFSCFPFTTDQPEWTAFYFFYMKFNVFWSLIQQFFNLRIYLLILFHPKCICRQKFISEKLLKKICFVGPIVIENHSFWNIDRTVKSTCFVRQFMALLLKECLRFAVFAPL